MSTRPRIGASFVSKNKANLGGDTKLETERTARKMEVMRIQQELEKDVAMKSKRRNRLEEQLKVAEDRMEALTLKGAPKGGAAHIDFDQRTVSTAATSIVSDSLSRYSGGGRFLTSVDEPEPVALTEDEGPLKWEGSDISVSTRKKKPSQHQQAARRKLSTKKRMKYDMDEEHTENNERIIKLVEHVGSTLASEPVEKEKLKNHWEYKSTRLLTKCLRSQRDKEKQYRAAKEMEDWKRIQEERIASVQQCWTTDPSSLGGVKRFPKRASSDPSFRATLQRVVSTAETTNEQIREEAKIEMMALEELIAMNTETLEHKRELVMVQAILESTPEDPYKAANLVYLLSCKSCHEQMDFVGSSETDLQTTIEKHYEQVVNVIKKSQGNGFVNAFKKSKSKSKSASPPAAKNGPAPPPTKSKSKSNGPDAREAWSKDFAQHVAKHCKPKSKFKSVSEADALQFCRDNIKIQVLRRQDGAAMYWEEQKQALAWIAM